MIPNDCCSGTFSLLVYPPASGSIRIYGHERARAWRTPSALVTVYPENIHRTGDNTITSNICSMYQVTSQYSLQSEPDWKLLAKWRNVHTASYTSELRHNIHDVLSVMHPYTVDSVLASIRCKLSFGYKINCPKCVMRSRVVHTDYCNSCALWSGDVSTIHAWMFPCFSPLAILIPSHSWSFIYAMQIYPTYSLALKKTVMDSTKPNWTMKLDY